MSKRTSKLTIRLTPEEYKYFLAVQRASGLSQADFLMNAINKMSAEEKQEAQEKTMETTTGSWDTLGKLVDFSEE